MSNHAQVAPSALIPVSFHSDNLFLVGHNGEPFVPMRPIVEGMGLDWKSQHVKIKSNQERFSVVEITTQIPGDDQQRSVTCMPLRKLCGWMAGIHPNKVRPELDCDDLPGYAGIRGAQNTQTSGPSLRHRDFFAPIGFCYGRECDGYNTRKGKKSAHLVLGFELPPTRVSKARPKSRDQEQPL